VLARMALVGGDTVADSATRAIAGVVIRRNSAGARRSGRDDSQLSSRAITALGALPFARALPVLDSLATRQSSGGSARNGRVADELIVELERASLQSYTASLHPDSARARQHLMATLGKLTNKTKPIREQLAQLDSMEQAELRSCAPAGDRVCDDRDKALLFIADNPALEFGYQDLVAHHGTDYRGAASALETIIARHPERVWPRKSLATLYHESLAIEDTSFFAKSYEVMRELGTAEEYRALRASSPDDYLRIQTDFAEVAFSARRDGETEALARGVLARSTDPTQRLNAALFAYMSAVVAGDPDVARRFARLQSVARALPPGFDNNFAYPGTEHFIRVSGVPPAVERALLKLCRPGSWYSRAEAATVFDENQRALAALRPS